MLGGQELILIFLAIIFFFGPSKLPEFARALGRASGEFKKAQIDSQIDAQIVTTDERRKDTHIKEKTNISHNIIKLAKDLGISTEGKDENLLLDEIKAIIKNNGIHKNL